MSSPPRVRTLASVLAVGVCGYFSLGTSCDSVEVGRSASMTIRLEPGEAMAALLVHAEGEQLRLHFDQELVITREGMPTEPVEGEATPQWPRMGTVCQAEVTSSPGTLCTSSELSGHARFELFRADTTQAMEIEVQATVSSRGDCAGQPPEKLGVRLSIVEPP